MTNKISNRVNSIQTSKSIFVAQLVTQLKREGKDVVNLSQGEPDFNTPEIVQHSTYEAIKNNKTKYDLVPGTVELRESLVKQISNEYNLSLDISNFVVSNGSKQSLYNIFQTLCNDGDEVIIISPYWVTFPETIKLAGGKPIIISCREDYQLDIEKINSAITEKTRAILINSPNNPTGAVYPKEDILKIYNLCKKNNIILVSDEAYDKLAYEEKFISPLEYADEKLSNLIITRTFSKSYCMTGFRIGYTIADKEFSSAMTKFQGHLCGNVPSFIQEGAITALTSTKDEVQNFISTFKKRKELAQELFKDFFDFPPIQGAIYVFGKLRIKELEKYHDCENFCKTLLEEVNVAIIPGSAFGSPGYIRISFAASEESLKEAHRRISNFLGK